MTLLDPLIVIPFRSAMFPLASHDAMLCVCDQGTDEWHRARLGIPTASCASSLVTPTGKPRTGMERDAYAYELALERVYGRDMDAYTNADMEDGHAQEAHARDEYAHRSNVTVEQVGFVYGDKSKSWGCSPDGVVICDDSMGLVEIKRRGRSAMSKVLCADSITPPAGEMAQMQFGMWVTGATWADYVLYFPASKPIMLVTRIEPNAELHETFAIIMPEFNRQVAIATDKIKHLQ